MKKTIKLYIMLILVSLLAFGNIGFKQMVSFIVVNPPIEANMNVAFHVTNPPPESIIIKGLLT